MIKILFIAKHGHDLTYFNTLKKYIESRKGSMGAAVDSKIKSESLSEKKETLHRKNIEFTEKNESPLEENIMEADLMFNIPFFFLEIFSFFKVFSLSNKDFEEALIPVIKRKFIKYGAKTAKFYSIWFSLIGRLYYIKYMRILKQGKYNIVCLWGGYSLAQGMAAMAAKALNIKVFYFENGLLPNTTVMDYKGTNFNNSVPRLYEFYNNVPITEYESPLIPRSSQKPANEKILLPPKYIFCPFQVALDNQILLHSPWVTSMDKFYEILEKTLPLLSEEDLIFIIKEHPACPMDYSELHNKNNPRIIFANSNNTENLIKNSEMIITINSTVGIEALMLEKKVVTLGDAFYSGFGFAKGAGSVQEISEIINTRDSWSLDIPGIKRFLSYLKSVYLIPGAWRSPTLEHMEKVTQKFLS